MSHASRRVGCVGKSGEVRVHDFQESLKLSQSYADAPWWEPVYREAFPGFNAMTCVRGDCQAQRLGIDRIVTLKSGQCLRIDEKVRARDWPDFALERWSDNRKHRPVKGWVQKQLQCDYIAYAFVPSRTCYLLPFQQLRRAWIRHGREWIDKAYRGCDGFRVVDAKNREYTTESIAVPRGVLIDALLDAMRVVWV